MQKNNIIILFIAFFSLLVTFLLINSTYALLETKSKGDVDINIGGWVIKINDKLISNGVNKEFDLNDFIYDESNNNIENGYFAPGKSGYVDIVLDAKGTDVAIDYKIIVDINEEDFPGNIKINVENLTNDSEIIRDNNSFSGLISLDDIKNDKLIILRISLVWEDIEEFNKSDSELGVIEYNKFKVPIKISLDQHI